MKPSPQFTLATLLLVLLVTAILSGCNTMRGAGQDIERTGERIGDATR